MVRRRGGSVGFSPIRTTTAPRLASRRGRPALPATLSMGRRTTRGDTILAHRPLHDDLSVSGGARKGGRSVFGPTGDLLSTWALAIVLVSVRSSY